MQAAHAREGQQVEDSGHLRPESAAAGMPGLRGLAPAGSFANPHARIRSAPPARARTSLGSPNNKAKPAPWIPSIPGRISQGLTPLVPALGVYSGTCSAASSRVPSCKSRQLLSTESQGEGQPSVSHRRVGDRMSSTHASSHNGELLTKETSFTRPCTSNILHSPRANWKCTDKGWSKLSQTSHSTPQSGHSYLVPASRGPGGRAGQQPETHVWGSISQSVQTDKMGDALQQITNVRTSASQTGLRSLACPFTTAVNLHPILSAKSADDIIQDFHSARQRLVQIENGERSMDLPAEFPNLCHMPVMKGKLSPAVLMRHHHLKHADVVQLYDVMHVFSYEFHQIIVALTNGATHSHALKHAVWVGLAELWQAGLCVSFPSDIQNLVEERDKAFAAVQQTAAECANLQARSSGLKEQHSMLASNAAERLQAEGTLRAQKGSLVGEVAMLSQAKEGLALRVAQLKSSLGVADSLAESRLKECQAAVLQVRRFEKVIETQNVQLSQKTKLLGSQWVEIQQLQQEKRSLCQQLKDGGNEDRVQALQIKLQSMEQDADGLRINAESHGKQVAFFKAQTTALQMKLKKVVAENARFESLCSAAQSKAEDSLIASRKFEAEACALAHKLENEKMRQADIEAQAWHAVSRRNEVVQAYQPMLKRIHTAERMQHNAQLKVDSVSQEMANLQTKYDATLEELRQLQNEHDRLLAIEEQRTVLVQQNSELKAELKDVLSKTRPLRVLIAFKRYQVQSLNHQLADLLELHADSAARARTAQAALKKGPEGGGCSGSGDSQDGQLDEVRSEQGDESVPNIDRQAQEHLQQKLAEAIERLDIVHADLAATQIEKAHKDEMLEEYMNMKTQLESKLQQSNANISFLKECKERLEKDLSLSVNATASAESQLADECYKHKVCQETCSMIQNDLARLQGDLQASIETSALQNQAIQERASHLEQNCDELVLAITGHCNALQTALKSFRSSCCNACDSEDAGTADSQAKLFASVNELLSFASTENLAEGQELAGSHGTAETRPQELPGVQGAADALQRLDVVMQNAGNVFTALADLNLHAQIQKREVHVQELGQRVMELKTALSKLTESDEALQRSEKDRHVLAEQLHAANRTASKLEQELSHSVVVTRSMLQACDARKLEVERLQGQCDTLQSQLRVTLERCDRSEVAALTVAAQMQTLQDNTTDLNKRIVDLECDKSKLRELERLARTQLAEADAKMADTQQHVKDHKAAAMRLQAACDSLEEELDGTYQELDNIQRQEAQAQSDLHEVKEELATVQGRLQDITRLWLCPEMAGSLRLEAEEWQAKHDKIEHRYTSLLDDFQHLSDRKGAVETERRRQHELRRRVAGLHAGLGQVQSGMAELQQRCCDADMSATAHLYVDGSIPWQKRFHKLTGKLHEAQVTQTGMGIISWADKCMAFAEDMQKGFIGALEEHDAAITRADLPGLHGACLSALRTRMHQLEAGQPSDSTPQLVSIKRMEVRVEQMQKQLANKQEVEQTLRTTVHGLQKENIALQENNTELRDELKACGRTTGAAESSAAQARELRGRVDKLTSMHKIMFGRMLRLALLATEKQEGSVDSCTSVKDGTGGKAIDLNGGTQQMGQHVEQSRQSGLEDVADYPGDLAGTSTAVTTEEAGSNQTELEGDQRNPGVAGTVFGRALLESQPDRNSPGGIGEERLEGREIMPDNRLPLEEQADL